MENNFSLDTVKRGFYSGIDITWQLTRIVVPVYFVVTFVKYTPLMGFVTSLFSPIMGLFGLPGNTAIVLVLGNFVNLHAAIGAMMPLGLTARESVILAAMLSFCHSLPVETALAKKVGLPASNVILVRVGLAVLSGIILNIILT